jgi:anti-sigma B factor antagonist
VIGRGQNGSVPPEEPLREALRPSGPPRFGLSVDHQPGAVVVRVDGELDLLTVPKLAASLNGVIRTSANDVVLDLRDVRFMDSAGLQLLLTTRRRLLRASRTLSVICDDGPVRRTIEVSRLTETLGVISS